MGGSPRNTPEAFWERVDRSGDCWLWTGSTSRGGYGHLRFRGRAIKAHRLAWELDHSRQLTSDELVLHSCDTPACCNPSHLRVGTHEDNMRDRAERRRHHNLHVTVCPHGHRYDEANTYWNPGGGRKCRACQLRWKREANARRKARALAAVRAAVPKEEHDG